MSTPESSEAGETGEEAYKPSLKDRIVGYTALATIVGAIGGGGYLGYELFNGSISSNHRRHLERIAQYNACKAVVDAKDTNHDGIARTQLETMSLEELQACGFDKVWDETAHSLDKRKNMLDGWVVNFGLTGEVQLPSVGALDAGIEDQKNDSKNYAVNKRTDGVMIGGLAGVIVGFAGGLTMVSIPGRRERRKNLRNNNETEPDPDDWFADL